ncbi:MAG: NtrZ family periplasmic regulatory protein [Pseudomonadota bacterium]
MKGSSVIFGALVFASPLANAETVIVPTLEPVDFASPAATSTTEAPDWFKTFTLADPEFVTPEASPEGVTQRDLKLRWLKTGRWELTLDLTSRDAISPLPREEMAAGATYQITPRLSVGGDVTVGAQELDDQSEWDDQDIEAGIKLRSAFRF